MYWHAFVIVLYILVHSIPLVFEILFLLLFALVLNPVQSTWRSNYPEFLFALHYTFVSLNWFNFLLSWRTSRFRDIIAPWFLCRWLCKFVVLQWNANFCLQTLQVTLLLSTLSKYFQTSEHKRRELPCLVTMFIARVITMRMFDWSCDIV